MNIQRVLLTIVLYTCVANAYAQTILTATGQNTLIISQVDKMIKDLAEKLEAGQSFSDIIAGNPALYSEYNVNDLIKMGIEAKYLDNAYDYLSKAELIISGMNGDTTKLAETLYNAGTQVAQRPLNAFLDRAKTLYKDNKDICDETDLSKMLSKIGDALIKGSGMISSQVEAEIIFGTQYNLYKDSFFVLSDDLPLNKDLSHHMDLIRVLILANSKEIQYEGNKNLIVDLFTENVRMTNVFFGAGAEGSSNLTKLTKQSADFKLVDAKALDVFSTIKTHVELELQMKSSRY